MKEKIKKIIDLAVNFYKTKKKLSLIIIGSFSFLLLIGFAMIMIMRPPTPPEDLKASVRGYGRIHLTWIDQKGSGFYNIYRSKEFDTTYEKVGSTQNWHYEDRDLDPETTYYYRITKIVRDKESSYSAEVHATTAGVGAPMGLRAGEIGHNYIQILWDGFPGSEGYVIYRTDSLDKPYAQVNTTTNTYYYDSGLENNKAYYYVVTQIIDGMESDYSKRELIATRDWTCGTAIEYDGKYYNTLVLGEQCWFAENLNYETEIGSWCYNDDSANCDRYGRIYDWKTLMAGDERDGAQGICPDGWRVPTDEDFKILERNLGMTRIVSNDSEWRGEELNIGDVLKVSTACTKIGESFCGSSGFNLFLGGSRSTAGAFRYIGTHSFLWTSAKSGDSAWRRLLSIENNGVHRDLANIENGFYVRCLKNN
jgi:uncharacterized protein (TIGR02145 family)